MKFNNYFVVFDLETTDDPKDRRIIEIGAVVLNQHLWRMSSTFQSYVFPGCQISDYVSNLTGIKQEQLVNAPSFPKVISQFEKWVAETVGSPKLNQPRLAAWGNYFDINVLRTEYERHYLKYPFSGTCFDVKTLALTWKALAGKRTDSDTSVESTMKQLGIEANGRFHSALFDAEVTAMIFRRAMSDLDRGFFLDGKHYQVREDYEQLC